MDASTKLMGARCRLLLRDAFLGHMIMSMEWKESDMGWLPEEARSLGIKITADGVIRCYYYPKWVESMTIPQLIGALQHIVYHLVRLHITRQRSRDPQAWGLATDMCVNGREGDPRIGYREDDGKMIFPQSDMVWIPNGWPDNEDAEYYYDRLIKESNKKPNGGGGSGGEGEDEGEGQSQDGQDGDGDGQGQGQGQGGQGKGKGRKGGKGQGNRYQCGKFGGNGVDDHEMWSQTELSQDEIRQIVSERVRDAAEKSQGHVPGHLADAIEKLKKPVVRWREELRQYFGSHVGNRRRTYSRPERRFQRFGDKGVSHHAAATVLVIVDTSGSIGQSELEQFFGEIDAISAKASTHCLLWDADFQGYKKYRKGAWRTFPISGRGGTLLDKAFHWAEEHDAIGDVTVLLTDGYTPWPAPRPYPVVFCITTPKGQTADPEFGKIIRLKVHE